MCNNEAETMLFEEVRTIFVLKDRLVHGLQNILSVAENRAITVKRTFCGKPINILVDTGCDIICISCRIALRSEWKKVHNLQVHGFNKDIINCLAKVDIDWKMDGISVTWKDTWVLPTMAYDIIIDTNWMQKHDSHISFSNQHIKVNNQTCKIENLRKDLI
jgi:hypothetical protein